MKNYFENIKTTNTCNEFYLPMKLVPPVIRALERAGIPYTSYSSMQVSKREIPHPEITHEELEAKLQKFRDNGFDKNDFLFLMALIVTPADEADLFEKMKLFYGPTMDPYFAENEADAITDGTEPAEQEKQDIMAWKRWDKEHPKQN